MGRRVLVVLKQIDWYKCHLCKGLVSEKGHSGPKKLGLESEKGHPGPKRLSFESGSELEGAGRAFPALMQQSCRKNFVIFNVVNFKKDTVQI